MGGLSVPGACRSTSGGRPETVQGFYETKPRPGQVIRHQQLKVRLNGPRAMEVPGKRVMEVHAIVLKGL